MPSAGFPSGCLSDFQKLVADRVQELFREQLFCEHAGRTSRGAAFKGNSRLHFVMPLALLLVIDESNGGDITARELAKRFHSSMRSQGT